MKQHRITVRDIAREAGVHYTTVSRALAKHPSIPEDTRIRITKIADALGYAPDPMVSALASYRMKLAPTHYLGTIAWVTNASTRDGWNTCSFTEETFQGAKERATQLGYKLDPFWLREPQLNQSRAESILFNRSIRGLIMAPQEQPNTKVDLNWSTFSAVSIGYSMSSPRLTTVIDNQFSAVRTTVQKVRAYGYKRIGFLVSTYLDQRVLGNFSGSFLAQQLNWPVKERVPIYINNFHEFERISNWIKKHKIDAIIANGDGYIIQLMEKNGIKIPRDIGYASFIRDREFSQSDRVSGIDMQKMQIGAVAVETVVGMLSHNDFGIPNFPKSILIENEWHEGETLIPQ